MHMPPSHEYFTNMFQADGDLASAAGGVLFVVRRSLAHTLAEVRHDVLIQGRAIATSLRLRGGVIVVIVGVHTDPALSMPAKRTFLRTTTPIVCLARPS